MPPRTIANSRSSIKMHCKFYALIGLIICGQIHAATPNNYEITTQQLQKHVNYLSSNALQGRLTGTAGEKLATQYVASVFQKLGLIPAGDHGTYFQKFDFTAGVALGNKNSFILTDKTGHQRQLKLNQEWRPLAFSDNITFTGTELISAGYGITAPTYNSYRGLNVKNKWVIVYRYTPANQNQLTQYSSLRYKAFTAKEHGAQGIIFVSEQLAPFSNDAALTGSGIIALSVTTNVLKELLNSSFAGQTDIKKILRHGRNVIAKLTITNSAAPVIIIGAHVDHLGHGELSGSLAKENEIGKIHPGADDNASGVASILEVAAKLTNLKAQGKLSGNKNIIFAAWSGEEFGLLGSTHFIKNYLYPEIDAAINLDMVGHLREKLVLQGVASSLDWPNIIKANQQHLTIVTQSDPYLPTDSTTFYLQGVPTMNFFTGAHDAYHTPRDTPNTLNYAGIKIISDSLTDMTKALITRSNAMTFNQVAKPDKQVARNFKIYLGTIPDYTSPDIAGVKLSGVAKNSPAEVAGLQHNDIIIELAGKSIHDIYDYTFVLNSMTVGSPVTIVVQRGATKKILTIVARNRG